MFLAVDGKVFPVDARLQAAIYCLQKVRAVRLNMESDQIGSQQALQQLALPWTDSEGFRIGPRNVPENSHARVRPRFFYHLRQKSKVVVLHQKDRLLCPGHFFEDSLCKLPVSLGVVLPVRDTKHRARVRDMAKRPQALVGETVVI